MPLFLIRATTFANTIIAVPSPVDEIEIEAPDLRSAAEAVMVRPKGPLPHGMNFRIPTHEAYSNPPRYIEPDRARYAGIADITIGNRATLPAAPVAPEQTPVEIAVDSATKVMTAYQCNHGWEGGPDILLFQLLCDLRHYADAHGLDFRAILQETNEAYGIARDDSNLNTDDDAFAPFGR